MATHNPAKGITWDLSDLYPSPDHPKVEKDRKAITLLTQKFTQKYKGKIGSPSLTPQLLSKSLEEYERIISMLYRSSMYFRFHHDLDTASEKIGKAYQTTNEFGNRIATELVWYDLEWIKQNDKIAGNLIVSPALEHYRHYLRHTRVFKPFTRSIKEEQIITKMSQSGASSFVRLYDEIDSNISFKLKIKGKAKDLNQSELSPYLKSHPDRSIRKRAAEAYTKGLEQNSRLYTFILNTLLLDKRTDDEIRGYEFPQQATLLGYEIDKDTLDAMVKAVQNRHDICEKFYKAKAKFLGIKKLHEWDRYSPIIATQNKEYSWDESQRVILQTFNEFSPEFMKIGSKFYDGGWIDAEIKKGKVSGAYCSYTLPDHHPYILTNYSGRMEDILTIAHELGHGIHAYLSRKQNLLQFYPSTATAEIASNVCESIVYEKLYSQITDKQQKLDLLCTKIQDIFASVFRQTAFYKFEEEIHLHRRNEGELATEEFSKYYQSHLQKTFGEGLELTDLHHLWWMPISHFYHYNFYVFTYAMGELLTMSLFALYKEQGQQFVKNYLAALSAGGSKDPYEITKMMGVDIRDAEFWSNGLDIVDGYVEEFVELAKSYMRPPSNPK